MYIKNYATATIDNAMYSFENNTTATMDMTMYSVDDMNWLCNWGGVPLLQWETCGFSGDEPCLLSHLAYWLQKENEHIRISSARMHNNLPPMNDVELAILHSAMTEVLWQKNAQEYHDKMLQQISYKNAILENRWKAAAASRRALNMRL